MKKLLTISLVLILSSVALYAQSPRENIRRHSVQQNIRDGRLNRTEISILRHHQLRYELSKHRARRDGVVTLRERRKLNKQRLQNRREAFRYKHNRYRRLS